jgi:hypothetical protein
VKASSAAEDSPTAAAFAADRALFGEGRSCRDTDGREGSMGAAFETHLGVKSSTSCKALCQNRGDACTGIEHSDSIGQCRLWLIPIGGAVAAPGSACFQRKLFVGTTPMPFELNESFVGTTPMPTAKQEAAAAHIKGKRPAKCGGRFKAPKKPKTADEHNGVALEDVCFEGSGPHHVFIIGDWGGITQGDGRLAAAPHLTHRWETNYEFVWPPDEQAQILVRDQMRKRAPESKPDYFLNMGDNFYWSGVEDHCGAEDITKAYSNGGTTVYKESKVDQFEHVFENVYTGDGIDDKQWLGILGNHDYGGWLFTHAWDQNIGYTWSDAEYATGRWMTPAMYYKSKVWYPDFEVDYYFLDTNIFDALDPKDPSPHNICSEMHNDQEPVTCAPVGPSGVWKCQDWFGKLWKEQREWLDDVVPTSTADWRIVVTHFPPCWGAPDWKKLAPKHEIDLVIAGHRHIQDMHAPGDDRKMVWHADPNELYNDFLDPTVWVVSGGGGGVTSERGPSLDGNDDQYGFMDMTLAKDKITIEGISHGGQLRRTLVMEPAFPHHPLYSESKAKAVEKGKGKVRVRHSHNGSRVHHQHVSSKHKDEVQSE